MNASTKTIFLLITSILLWTYGVDAAENKGQWGINFACNKQKNQPTEACRALNLYKQGVIPRETPLHGVRIVDVGYLMDSDGKPANQLIVVEFSWSRNFHRKLYYPNKICAFSVIESNEQERISLETAIKELRDHKVPVKNAAYEWAMNHDISSKQCRSLEMNEEGTALVSETGNWSIATAKGHYIFVAKVWGESKADMVLLHRPVD